MEQIFKELTFLVHVIIVLLIYQQISGNKFRWYQWSCLILICGILSSFMPVLGTVICLFFLLVYSIWFKQTDNLRLAFFYGLYPNVVASLFSRVLTDYLLPLFGLYHVGFNGDERVHFFIELLVFPLYFYLTKFIKINFSLLKQGLKKLYLNQFIVVMNLSMCSYLAILEALRLMRNYIPQAILLQERLVGIYTIIFLVMLVYLNTTLVEKLKEEIVYQKEQQLQELITYSQHVEDLYNEIKYFRHDYLNILTSIHTGLENRDLIAIQTVYDQVLTKTKEQFTDEKYHIANLVKITNPALKSVIATKLLAAQSQNIKLRVEIDAQIGLVKLDILDLINVISILLDNALEEARLTKERFLVLAIFEVNNKEVIIVENSTRKAKVDLTNLFVRGYSTKGAKRGYGLVKLRKILDNYPNVLIKTKSSGHIFSQIIEIN